MAKNETKKTDLQGKVPSDTPCTKVLRGLVDKVGEGLNPKATKK